jgi:hypothetical protein
MKQHFNPRSQLGMFYAAHDQAFGRLTALAELQNGPNPITEEEWRRLQEKHPGRYGHIPYVRPRAN